MSEYYVEKDNQRMARDGIEFFSQSFPSTQNNVPPHIHSAVEMLFIARGDFRVFSGDEEFIVQEGGAVLFRSHTIHRVYPMQADSLYYVLKVNPSFILDFSSKESGSGYLLSLALHNEGAKTVWTKEECEQNRIRTSVTRLFEEADRNGYGSDMAIRICAAEIVLALLRDTEKQLELPTTDAQNENLIRRIYDAIVYINKHYPDDITAESCSQHVFLSYSYFSRSFKRITGHTFKDYLILTRLNHAEKELVSTEKPITEIASGCGFNSVSYFIAMFKKVKGATPSAFRNMPKQ